MKIYKPNDMTATVKYQVATYKGEIKVNCKPNDEDEHIIAKAKKIISFSAKHFPLGYQSWKVISRN